MGVWMEILTRSTTIPSFPAANSANSEKSKCDTMVGGMGIKIEKPKESGPRGEH